MRLDKLYKNWQAEYKDAVMSEDCEEIRKFYKPYLEKYESKLEICTKYCSEPINQQDKPVCSLHKSQFQELPLIQLH